MALQYSIETDEPNVMYACTVHTRNRLMLINAFPLHRRRLEIADYDASPLWQEVSF